MIGRVFIRCFVLATFGALPTTPARSELPSVESVAAPQRIEVSPSPTLRTGGLGACGLAMNETLNRTRTASGSRNRSDQAALVEIVRSAETLRTDDGSNTCADSLLVTISNSPSCGGAADLVVSQLAQDNAISGSAWEAALENDGPCSVHVVAGAASLEKPAPSALFALRSWLERQTDPLRRSGALMAMGTLARKARGAGDFGAAAIVDSLIVAELGRSSPAEIVTVQRIEAAGNAGCELCVPALKRAAIHPSATVRRASVGALRFVSSAEAVITMCDPLERDADTNVREQAAWALGWQSQSPELRVDCLVRTAARDKSERVRMTAATALAGLSPTVPLARSAMLHLTTEGAADEGIRAIALLTVEEFSAGVTGESASVTP